MILDYNEKQPTISTFINLPEAVNHRNYKIFMNDFRVNGGINGLVALLDGYAMFNKTKTLIPQKSDNTKILYFLYIIYICYS